MRAGSCRFNTSATWWPAYEQELLRFTGTSDAVQDDQFDSSAILVKGLELMAAADEEDFIDEDELEMMQQDPRKLVGRSTVTGY